MYVVQGVKSFDTMVFKKEICPKEIYAAMGIRTPVASVRGSHDWPDYTIAAMQE
jgi:hypothetical protein